MFCSTNREEIVFLLSAVNAQGMSPGKTRFHLAVLQETELSVGLLPEHALAPLHPHPPRVTHTWTQAAGDGAGELF